MESRRQPRWRRSGGKGGGGARNSSEQLGVFPSLGTSSPNHSMPRNSANTALWVIAGAFVLVIACGVGTGIYCNAYTGGELQDSGHGRVAAQPLLPAAPPPSPPLPLMRTVPSKMACFSCPLCLTELKAKLATCERQNAKCAGELRFLHGG